jgi:hypothetical protein
MMQYWQIRLNIFLLRSIAPFSIFYSVFRICHTLIPKPIGTWRLPWPLAYWAFAEATSYIYLYLPYKYYFLQLPAEHPKALPRREREKLFLRCWDTVEDPEQYLKGWFRGAQKEEIGRDNVRRFVHWAFFNAQQLSAEEDREIDGYLEIIELRLGRSLPSQGSAVSLRTTLDTVHCTYRSILWYLVSLLLAQSWYRRYAD